MEENDDSTHFELDSLDIEIYTKVNGNDKKIDYSETFDIELSRESIIINLKTNFLVRDLQFQIEGIKPDRIKADYYNTSGQKIDCKNFFVDTEKSITGIKVHDILNKIYLFYKPGFFEPDKIKIRGIRVYGLALHLVENYIDKISRIDSYEKESSDKIEKSRKKLEEERNSHQSLVSDLQAKASELETSISNLQKQENSAKNQAKIATDEQQTQENLLNEKKSLTENLIEEKIALENKIDILKKDLHRLESSIDNLKSETQEKESKIRELVKKYSMYSNEYASFNKQGNKFISLYSGLSLIPFGILILFIVKMFSGAVDLTTLYTKQKDIDLSTILLTRLPFVTISLVIISSCFYSLKFFIMKIFDIQSAKLALTKLSILSQDVVTISSSDLKLSDEQIHEANIYLRMELLKSYLEGDIDRSFQYKARDKKLLDMIGPKLGINTHTAEDSSNEVPIKKVQNK